MSQPARYQYPNEDTVFLGPPSRVRPREPPVWDLSGPVKLVQRPPDTRAYHNGMLMPSIPREPTVHTPQPDPWYAEQMKEREKSRRHSHSRPRSSHQSFAPAADAPPIPHNPRSHAQQFPSRVAAPAPVRPQPQQNYYQPVPSQRPQYSTPQPSQQPPKQPLFKRMVGNVMGRSHTPAPPPPPPQAFEPSRSPSRSRARRKSTV